MTKFDAVRFLDDYNIIHNPYSHETTTEFTAVNCPYCGGHEKMGIHMTKGFATCWTCNKGKDFWDVVSRLTGESYVKPIIEKYGSYLSRGHQEIQKTDIKPTKVDLIGSSDISSKDKAFQYIRDVRGFDPIVLFKKYGLRFTTHGFRDYNYRIIFPITFNNKVVSFQGRDYTEEEGRVRFMALKSELEVISHQHILYNLDNCTSDNILVLEGIFDNIRVGDNSACSFGISFTREQANLLRSRFRNVFILYDEEEKAQEQAEKLGYLIGSGKTNVEVISLGISGSDPDLIFQNAEDDLWHLKKELNLY